MPRATANTQTADPKTPYAVRKVSLPDPPDGFANDLAHQPVPVVGFHVTGPCPGCTHETTDVFPTTTLVMDGGAGDSGETRGAAPPADGMVQTLTVGFHVRGLRIYQSPASAEQPSVAMQRCQCDVTHDKSNGKDGCGAIWLIKAVFDIQHPENGATLSAPTDTEAASLWPSAEAMAASSGSSLKTVQAAATKWQQGLTAILGLVAIVSLIGGRPALETIAFPGQVTIVALAAIAVLANAWAIYQCTLSSIGFPKITNAADADNLVDYDLRPLRQTTHATNALRNGVLSAAASLAAALVAVAVLWLAPSTQASDVTVTFVGTFRGSTSVCGSLQSSAPSSSKVAAVDQITLKLANGQTNSYPLSKISMIDPGAC